VELTAVSFVFVDTVVRYKDASSEYLFPETAHNNICDSIGEQDSSVPQREWFDSMLEEGLDWQFQRYKASVMALFKPLGFGAI
jgi:hypothetical protein